ncbi:hypothetical protein E2I00_019820 [Balaenoptera physalus]|uniref:Transmembrane protein 14C n=1 Tax=Balaenoptera physalus TaxID=9770 RepID=A0A6A1QAE2_BALPH|nr:hypothetical protein E2I00_019820 [Balaenoptera physalus]
MVTFGSILGYKRRGEPKPDFSSKRGWSLCWDHLRDCKQDKKLISDLVGGGVLTLIAGLFVGFLAGCGAYRVSNNKRDVKLSLSFFLATIMGVRFKRSKKIMPAGLVAGLRFIPDFQNSEF